jgi:hypothetical protein
MSSLTTDSSFVIVIDFARPDALEFLRRKILGVFRISAVKSDEKNDQTTYY